MAQGIKGTGNHLSQGHGQGIGRIQDGEIIESAPKWRFALFGFVGDHGPVVHFSSGAKSSDHSPHGQEFPRLLVLGILILPDILLQQGLGGNDLAAVQDGSAAYGQDKVDFLFPGQTGAFLDLFVGGIGHDPGKIEDGFAGFFQEIRQFFINAVSFDGTAP